MPASPEVRAIKDILSGRGIQSSINSENQQDETIIRIYNIIKGCMNNQFDSYQNINLKLLQVKINPNNKNQYLAVFTHLDKRDQEFRMFDICVTKLANNYHKDDLSDILETARGKCSRKDVEKYFG